MFEELAAAIEGLEVRCDRESLVAAIALRDRLDARIAEATGEFEANGSWGLDASVSMTAWLRANARMTRRAAQRLRSVAVRLRSLPVCARAYAEGNLSGGQVEAIVAVLDDEVLDVFAAHEAELVPYLVPLTVAGVSRAMGAWLTRPAPSPPSPRSRRVPCTCPAPWMTAGSSTPPSTPESGAVVDAALRLALPDKDDVAGGIAARRAAALADVCRFYLDHQRSRPGGRHRPHVNVVVELDDLLTGRGGRVVDGPGLDGPTLSRLFCDSAVHRVVMAGRSSILDYGTSTRTIPAPLWSALVIRDEGCRFPGCDRPSVWCEGHHVVWVTRGGPTELANLVLVCTRHHHRLHQPGGRPSSCPTRPSRSPIPTASSAAPHRRAPNASGEEDRSDQRSSRDVPPRLILIRRLGRPTPRSDLAPKARRSAGKVCGRFAP